MVESGADSFVAEPMFSGVMSVIPLSGSEKDRDVRPSDFRELEAQGLIRSTTGHGYDLTNLGRATYAELKNLPRERPPVGFQPT